MSLESRASRQPPRLQGVGPQRGRCAYPKDRVERFVGCGRTWPAASCFVLGADSAPTVLCASAIERAQVPCGLAHGAEKRRRLSRPLASHSGRPRASLVIAAQRRTKTRRAPALSRSSARATLRRGHPRLPAAGAEPHLLRLRAARRRGGGRPPPEGLGAPRAAARPPADRDGPPRARALQLGGAVEAELHIGALGVSALFRYRRPSLGVVHGLPGVRSAGVSP